MIYGRVLALAALAAVVSGKRDLDNYSFENFVAEFKHKWSGEEYQTRKAIFETELARVKLHNAGKASWKAGINKFSAMTVSEKQALLGNNKDSRRSHVPKHEIPFPAGMKMKSVDELPKSVDWRTHVPNVVSAVKDQGHCGSCWAFSSTATLESHVALATGLLYDLSPQQIAFCSPNPNHCGGTGGCHGATAEIAFDYVAGSDGIVQEFELGYNAYYGVESACGVNNSTLPVATIEGFTALPTNDYEALMNAVAQVGPLAVSVDASTWHSYEGGIYNGCNQVNPDINHAVTLVGYGEENGTKFWLVRNSWSPSWGEAGYIKVLRADTDSENCGLDITPHHGSACDGEDDPVEACGTCGILFASSYPVGIKRA